MNAFEWITTLTRTSFPIMLNAVYVFKNVLVLLSNFLFLCFSFISFDLELVFKQRLIIFIMVISLCWCFAHLWNWTLTIDHVGSKHMVESGGLGWGGGVKCQGVICRNTIHFILAMQVLKNVTALLHVWVYSNYLQIPPHCEGHIFICAAIYVSHASHITKVNPLCNTDKMNLHLSLTQALWCHDTILLGGWHPSAPGCLTDGCLPHMVGVRRGETRFTQLTPQHANPTVRTHKLV